MSDQVHPEWSPLRTRLGALVPAVNAVVEPDFYKMAPKDVSVHFARMRAFDTPEGTSTEMLSRLEEDLEDKLESLAAAQVDAVAFACTSGSFFQGTRGDQALIARMEKVIHPATTTSAAVVSAFEKLGMKKVSVSTPYPDEINQLLIAFLREHGVEVVSLKSLGAPTASQLGRESPELAYRLAKSVDSPQADGVFISCTGFPAVAVIERLESELRKPVVTANQATFWSLLRLAGNSEKFEGYGELLRAH
jgi:maleate isomerase